MTDNDKLLQLVNECGQLMGADLSDLDLRKAKDLISGSFKSYDQEQEPVIRAWDDNVKWPHVDKMPSFFNPDFILQSNKKPKLIDALVSAGLTGKGMSIAIIDQRLNIQHPEYKDRIKHYEHLSTWTKDEPDYHGSLVTGVAVGKTTGVAPEADVYYIASNQQTNQIAIKRVIEINETLPEDMKIRFLSCSFDGGSTDEEKQERRKLFELAENNGMMVLGGQYKHAHDNLAAFNIAMIDQEPVAKFDVNNRQLGKLRTGKYISVPTDAKTNPSYIGDGYLFDRVGGISSTIPYLAGVYACVLQNNKAFMQQPNWQDKLTQIMEGTATITKDGSKIVNPKGIMNTVIDQTKKLNIVHIATSKQND